MAQTYLPLKISSDKIPRPNAQTPGRDTAIREVVVKGRASPSFSGGLRETRARAQYYMEWDDDSVERIYDCQLDFVGYSETVPGSGVGSNPVGIYRHIPYPHPKNPDVLYAESVESIEPDVPQGKDSDHIATYDEARLAVQFAQRPYIIRDDGLYDESLCQQYVTITVQTTGRYERIPNPAAFRFGTGQTLAPVSTNAGFVQPVGFFIGGQQVANTNSAGFNQVFPIVSSAMVVTFAEAEVSVLWHQVPYSAIPWGAISTCINKVEMNNNQSKFYNFLSNTYLGPILQNPSGRTIPMFVCLSPSISEPYQMINGIFAVDIRYRFKYYPYGAGYFFNWNSGSFDPAINSKTGKPFFTPANFNTLFLAV